MINKTIETKFGVNASIDKTPWRVSFEATVKPIRISNKDVQSGSKIEYWNNRLNKRQEKLEKGNSNWNKRYGEDKSQWPENIQAKADWRQKLVDNATSRVQHWGEIGTNAVNKINTFFGGGEGVEKVVISRTNNMGEKILYSVEMRDAGGYTAPFIVEQAESKEIIGVVAPQLYFSEGEAYILTERDKGALAQKKGNEEQCWRATRSGVDNPVFKTTDIGERASVGHINAQRIIGLTEAKFSADFDGPTEELKKGLTVRLEKNVGIDTVITSTDYKAMKLSEYSEKTLDIPGKAAAFDALFALQRSGRVTMKFETNK